MPAAALFLLLAAAISLGMAAVWFAVVKGAGSGWVDTVWSFLVGVAGIAAALVPVSGWEVHTTGNPLAHAILRGYVNHFGTSMPNYHYENLRKVADMYGERNLKNPAIVVDCNHNNSGKKYMEQIRIAKDVMASRQYADDILHIVKGLMIESYIVDGNQKIGDGVYGKSITDPCLGWEKSRDLILSLADMA